MSGPLRIELTAEVVPEVGAEWTPELLSAMTEGRVLDATLNLGDGVLVDVRAVVYRVVLGDLS